MFRGGRVDSRGTGITSGLAGGGRVGYQPGGQVTGLDFLKNSPPLVPPLNKPTLPPSAKPDAMPVP